MEDTNARHTATEAEKADLQVKLDGMETRCAGIEQQLGTLTSLLLEKFPEMEALKQNIGSGTDDVDELGMGIRNASTNSSLDKHPSFHHNILSWIQFLWAFLSTHTRSTHSKITTLTNPSKPRAALSNKINHVVREMTTPNEPVLRPIDPHISLAGAYLAGALTGVVLSSTFQRGKLTDLLANLFCALLISLLLKLVELVYVQARAVAEEWRETKAAYAEVARICGFGGLWSYEEFKERLCKCGHGFLAHLLSVAVVTALAVITILTWDLLSLFRDAGTGALSHPGFTLDILQLAVCGMMVSYCLVQSARVRDARRAWEEYLYE